MLRRTHGEPALLIDGRGRRWVAVALCPAREAS